MVIMTFYWHLSLIVVILVLFAARLSTAAEFVPHWNEEFKPHETCKSNKTNPYQYGYNLREIFSTNLYSKEQRLGSYVGYPCNVELYNKFKEEFLSIYLQCPFKKGLDENFRKFVNDSLFMESKQNTTDLQRNYNSLIFQYICFSKKLFEECKEVPWRKELAENFSTSPSKPYVCTGECQCMEHLPLEDEQFRPPLTKAENAPKFITENKKLCGVRIGGMCVPEWMDWCTNEVMDQYIARKYSPKDLYYQCQANAGCHSKKRVCECSLGHKCERGGGSVVPKNILTWSLTSVILWCNSIFYPTNSK